MRCPSCKELLDLAGARFCPACGATVEHLPDPLVGQVIGGRFRITHLVAEGGMGRVYAAEQTMGDAVRKVAIKVLLAEYSGRDQDVQRLARECSTVSELEHPNTIKFYDYGETPEGDLFIAMEFLSGPSLSQVIKAGQLPPDRVDLIVGQICGSLFEAHQHKIVHRDLKPDNIILTSPGGAPDFVKVLDFGIAKRINSRDPKLTPLGVVLGSPPYMSPEQFTMQDVDHKSDIYSLGVVVYQLLTGKLPFNANDPIEWAALHMGAQPTPIDAHGVPIPPQMRTAIHRALAKEPSARPETMRDFYAEFTIGSGSLEPGRLSSMMPLFSSQMPLPPPPKAPSNFPTASAWAQGAEVVVPASRLPRSADEPMPSSRFPRVKRTARGISARADSITPPAIVTPGKAGVDGADRDSETPTHVRDDPSQIAIAKPVFPDPDFSEDEPPTNVLEAAAAAAPKTTRDQVALGPLEPEPVEPPTAPGQPPVPSIDAPTLRDPMSAPPDISVHEISVSEISSIPSISSLDPSSLSALRETAAKRSDHGTIVMAASEPPPKKPASMPDLIPPTIRDPALLAQAVARASKKTLLWIALGLVGTGAIVTAVLWFFFLRPSPPPKRTKAKATSSIEAGARPPVESATAPQASPPPAPSQVPTVEPEPSASVATTAKAPEKLSPCQTAIFAAVSGKCDLAQRAYARCAQDSPYRASATRALNGLCASPSPTP